MSLNNLDKFKTNKPKSNFSSDGSNSYPIRAKFVSVQPDATQLIKFLDEGDSEDGHYMKWFHVVRRPNQWGSMATEYKLCLDQEMNGLVDCEWCEKRAQIANPKEDQQYRRSAQLMTNVLLKDAPIVKKVLGEWVTQGTEDKVQVYRCGITVVDQIKDVYNELGSIKNTWFKLKREGSGKEDTKYTLSPVYEGRSVKEAEENTPAQQELVDKYYINLPEYFEADSRGEAIERERAQDAVDATPPKVMKNPLQRN